MFSSRSSAVTRPALRCFLQLRHNGTLSTGAETDIRQRLMNEVKSAMRAKDALTSTTLRSVLSEVYAADKMTKSDKAMPSTIFSILRKAHQRRVSGTAIPFEFPITKDTAFTIIGIKVDSAAQFIQASREDLAVKERQEAVILEKFLPPLLSETEVDRVLIDVISTLNDQQKPNLGQVFKAFYARIDKSSVDPNLVKTRATTLLSS